MAAKAEIMTFVLYARRLQSDNVHKNARVTGQNARAAQCRGGGLHGPHRLLPTT